MVRIIKTKDCLEFTDDEDEVLSNLAEVLGGLADYIGGPQNIMAIVKPLEILASAEEGIIREKAAESLKKLLPLTKIKEHEAEIMALIKRLINNTESFASILSGAAIIPTCFPHVSPPSQQELTL